MKLPLSPALTNGTGVSGVGVPSCVVLPKNFKFAKGAFELSIVIELPVAVFVTFVSSLKPVYSSLNSVTSVCNSSKSVFFV